MNPTDTSERPAWRVLLIGGSGGTGKTTLGYRLAELFGVALAQVDDFRLTLQRITTPEEQPALHFFLTTPHVWQRPPDELCERLIAVGEVVSHALEAVIAHHLDTPHPIMLEGDGLLPTLAARAAVLGFDAAPVRSVWLYEPDEATIRANLTARGRGFNRLSPAEQRAQIRLNSLYGRWLREQAALHDLPVVTTRPWESLTQRALDAIPGQHG